MLNTEERTARDMERLEQLERRKRVRQQQETAATLKANTHRQIIIGSLVVKYFPDFLCFTPHRTNAENEVEFAPLANFLSILSEDAKYAALLKNSATIRGDPDNS